MCKQIVEEELTERDVNTLLEEAMQMVDLSREVASCLRARLLEAAVAIDEEKARKDPPKLILNNAMELDTLQNLKKSLMRFLTRLSIGGI